MAITTSALIQNFLRPGLVGILAAKETENPVYAQIFTKRKSNKNYEIDAEISLFGLAREKAEGMAFTYDAMRQTFTTTYLNKTIGTGFIITQEAMEDNLYEDQVPKGLNALKNSMGQTKEVSGAGIFNNAFDSNFPGGDGVSLVATNHPLANGTTQSNGVSTPVGLNESATQDFNTQIMKFRAASGLFDANISPRRYVVPPELIYNANRLVKSQYRPATANNDIAVVNDMDLLPEGYVKWRYLTSPTAWWIQTDADLGLIYQERIPLSFDTIEEKDTTSVKTTARERYAFGFTNFRAIVGTAGV